MRFAAQNTGNPITLPLAGIPNPLFTYGSLAKLAAALVTADEDNSMAIPRFTEAVQSNREVLAEAVRQAGLAALDEYPDRFFGSAERERRSLMMQDGRTSDETTEKVSAAMEQARDAAEAYYDSRRSVSRADGHALIEQLDTFRSKRFEQGMDKGFRVN